MTLNVRDPNHPFYREPRRIALIACSASKLDRPAPAREMYAPSQLFTASRRYAEATCDGWFVLSAKHGILAPDDVIEPYDERLTTGPNTIDGRTIPSPWAGDVSRGLLARLRVTGIWASTFVVLAGRAYAEHIGTLSLVCEYPLAGMGIGRRKAWLRAESALVALHGYEGTAVHNTATEIVERLGAAEIVLTGPCLLGCGQIVEHRDTAANASAYRHAPCGICGRCASVC